MENQINRMKDLIEELNKASELYYQKNISMMTVTLWRSSAGFVKN